MEAAILEIGFWAPPEAVTLPSMGGYTAFSPQGLNVGAQGHESARVAAEAAAAQVAAIEIDAAALGGVPAVAGFVAAALAARDTQARGCAQERDRRADLAGRVGTTGALGEELITDTTAIATSVAPPHASPK